MANYYANRPTATTPSVPENPTALSVEAPVLTEFDKHRKALLIADAEEGWAAELRRYLSTFQLDVEKDTDLVEWWQVSIYIANFTYLSLRFLRIMHNYIQHSVVLHLMCFRHKHHLLHASGYFQVVSKLRQTAVRAWVQKFLNNSS
jgi:hypothetical protein